MKSYSQRDPRWKDIRLGTPKSTTTIGSHGCTISCLSALSGLTPKETNSLMQKNNAYQVDLVIWSKIEKAIPNLFFVKRAYSYNNDEVKDAIKKYGGCLVEVDFDKRRSTTKDSHWVVYLGDQKLMDPWTGVVKSTSYYPIVKGYAIIGVKGKSSSDLEKVYSEKDFVEKLNDVKKDLELDCDREKDAIKDQHEKTIKQLQEENSDLKAKNEAVKTTALEKEKELERYIETLAKLMPGCPNDKDAVRESVQQLVAADMEKDKLKDEIDRYEKSFESREKDVINKVREVEKSVALVIATLDQETKKAERLREVVKEISSQTSLRPKKKTDLGKTVSSVISFVIGKRNTA